MDMLTFVLLLVSLVGNVVCVAVVLCLWKFIIPPSAMLLIQKRMGRLKDKMLGLVCYDDGVGVVKVFDVAAEGCLEREGRNGVSETYYLPRPKRDTPDKNVNLANDKLDKAMLPTFTVDGIPLAFCYAADCVTANPTTLVGISLANVVDEKSPTCFDAKIKIAAGNVRGSVVDAAKEVKVKVLLPFNPLDIHRAFQKFWNPSMMEATKMRYKNIGAAMNKNAGKDYFKFLCIIGLVACIALVAGGVIAGRFI